MRSVAAFGVLVGLASACGEEAPPEGSGSLPVWTSPGVETSYIARRRTWFCWNDGVDRGTAWTRHDWEMEAGGVSANAPLGYGETYVNPLSYGPDPARKPLTAYFRKAFYVEDPTRVVGLRLDMMFDDGFVAHVNGHEVARAGLPAGPVTYATRATSHEAGARYESVDASAGLGHLQVGWNTLAVEIHQADPASSDLVFDAGLIGRVRTRPAGEVIPRHAAWRYWDRGGPAQESWRAPGTAIDGWASGPAPLGYGESYLGTTVSYGPDASRKHATTYFVREFEVADPSAVRGVRAEIMFDDGLVVWLNGVRIHSEGLPAGPVTSDLLATGHETGNAYQTYDFTAYRKMLVPGVNRIAVEVHQQSRSSSDLTFDLALALETVTPEPGQQIAAGSTWSYWDRGPLASGGWNHSSFIDSGWVAAAAPLGYGEDDLATRIARQGTSAYFRKQFFVHEPDVASGLYADVLFDDGFVLYLNGTEIHRQPPADREAGGASVRFDVSAGLAVLRSGANLLAVEVQQSSAASTDLIFDLAFVVGTATMSPFSRHGLPVLSPSRVGGTWNEYSVESPSVTRLGDGSWVMYYTAQDENAWNWLARARSVDGVTWTPDPSPIRPGRDAAIVHDGVSFAAYGVFWPDSCPGGCGGSEGVSRVISTDGTRFTREPAGPVLAHGNPSWDYFIDDAVAVLREGDTYKMWYVGGQEPEGRGGRIGLATSPDGIAWTRHGAAVLTPPEWQCRTSRGEAERPYLRYPMVMKEGDEYWMFYTTVACETATVDLATSADGITWTRRGAIMTPGPPGGWDGYHLRRPWVVRHGETLRLWYTGTDSEYGPDPQIGFATNP